MENSSNEQILTEITQIKQEIRHLRDTLEQFHVAQVFHPYVIRVDEVQGGEPIVRDAYVTVRTIVEQIGLGVKPEELVTSFDNLTLAGIYDALSYYYDHREEMDEIIAQQHEALGEIGRSQRRHGPTALK